MSSSDLQLKADAWEQTHGYPQEVKCSTRGEVWNAYFRDGEPVEDDSLNCHCGGRGEVV